MKILEISVSGTVGTEAMGPISTNICELSNHFASRGHRVSLIDLPCTTQRKRLNPTVRIVECHAKPESWAATSTSNPLLRPWRRWRNYYLYMCRIASCLDLSAFDIVHVHAPELAFLIHYLCGVRVVYTAHTSVWGQDSAVSQHRLGTAIRLIGKLRYRINVWLEGNVAKHALLTIGLGNYLKVAFPEAHIETIPNGLNLREWETLDHNTAREMLGIGASDFVVLMTGRVARVKGVDVLLAAVKSVQGTAPNIKAVIIGPLSGSFDFKDEQTADYAQQMIELARGLPVNFAGFISNRDVRFRQHLAAADVFVVPSRFEAQGKVVIEALAMGTPVIGSATGGIPDMLTPDVGRLFPPGDSRALAECIREFHDDPQLRIAMRSAAVRRIASSYTWEQVADRHLQAFSRCLPARSGPAIGAVA